MTDVMEFLHKLNRKDMDELRTIIVAYNKVVDIIAGLQDEDDYDEQYDIDFLELLKKRCFPDEE